MARAGAVVTMMGGLETNLQRTLRAVFDYILGNLRIGRVVNATRAENMQWYFYQTTTPSTANEGFSIAHTLGHAPYVALQVLPLDAIGGEFVRLGVPRAADASRVYLTSPETDAPVTLLLEG